jgi:hypothetical protein
MSSNPISKAETQQAILKIIKALTSSPAQVLFYGSALLAIADAGGATLPGILGTLGTAVGFNVLANMLERVARGDDIHDDEIRKTVEDVIQSSEIDKLATSNEFQRAIAHVFRQINLLKYAIQKEESTVAAILAYQFSKYETILEDLHSEISEVHVQMVSLSTREQSEEILKNVQRLAAAQNIFSKSHFPILLIDQKIESDINVLRKSRFFSEFNREGYSQDFADRVANGELAGGSNIVRSRALAWCARVLSATNKLNKAEEYLNLAKSLGTNSENVIAQAFIFSQRGDISAALSILASIDMPSSRSAAFMIVANYNGPQVAVDWLKTTGLIGADLDSDGKNSLITYQLQLANWERAWECLDIVTGGDLLETPILNHLVAIAHLLKAVPGELRPAVCNQLPFMAANFPFASDSNALDARRKALRHFTNAASAALELNFPHTATIDDEYALWLELSDPEEFDKGKHRLETKLRDPNARLRLVHFALQFGVRLDLEIVEQEIERHIALHGGITENAAFARFALVFTQKTPLDAATYITRHRDELNKFFDKKELSFLEIEMLSRAGLPEKANERLGILIDAGLSEAEQSHLRALISEAEGVDPIETRKVQFGKTDSIIDLASLVDEFYARNDWESICEYGRVLFERTRSLQDAERLANALSTTYRAEQLIEFIKTNADLLSHSKNLQMLYCWALYDEGALLEARVELAKNNWDQDNRNIRALQINIGIALGDWNSLLGIIDQEWTVRDRRSAKDLISVAQLALHLNSPHTRGLIYAAVDKGKDDANVLVAAYMLATKAGWETDMNVFNWLDHAVKLSGDNGPIKNVTLKDLLGRKPDWDQRESEIWKLLTQGDIPIFLAAQSLNKSLIELTLVPALINMSEKDPRRRAAIPAFCGNRQPILLDTDMTIGIDATALISLNFLGLLDKTLDTFETVHVPHSTLVWLFEEKQRATFHQPSRIISAHQVRNMLATDVLDKLIPSTVPNSELSAQVGDELALLIAEAEKPRENDNTQHIVVRPSPVHLMGSLMMDEADLSPHVGVLSSCQSLVSKLRQKGQITAEEEKKAQAYLKLQEKSWPYQPEIADGAILYLDSLAITYLLHLGILERLKPAGFKPIVSPNEVSETNGLILYETISDKVKDAIENIRSNIYTRIESGKIKVDRECNINKSEALSFSDHPTIGIFALAGVCDAIIVDDRAFNRHAFIEGGGQKPLIYSTIDILDSLVSSRVITQEEYLDYRTRLRRAGYFLVPLNNEELLGHLNASIIKDNRVIETAELKAIRENLLCVRMSSWLQLPKEAYWLDMVLQTFIQVLNDLWISDTDLFTVRARSEWILDQVDIQGWAHRLGVGNRDHFVNVQRGANIMKMLMPLRDLPMDVREDYWNWIEEKILLPIKEQNLDLYSWIVDLFKRLIAKLGDTYLTERKAK